MSRPTGPGVMPNDRPRMLPEELRVVADAVMSGVESMPRAMDHLNPMDWNALGILATGQVEPCRRDDCPWCGDG